MISDKDLKKQKKKTNRGWGEREPIVCRIYDPIYNKFRFVMTNEKQTVVNVMKFCLCVQRLIRTYIWYEIWISFVKHMFVHWIYFVLCAFFLQSCQRTTLCLSSSQSNWTCWGSCCTGSWGKVFTKSWLGSLSMEPSSTWSTDTLAWWVNSSRVTLIQNCGRRNGYLPNSQNKNGNLMLISSRMVCFFLFILMKSYSVGVPCYTQFSHLITQHTH